jgi:hypothetical protein
VIVPFPIVKGLVQRMENVFGMRGTTTQCATAVQGGKGPTAKFQSAPITAQATATALATWIHLVVSASRQGPS